MKQILNGVCRNTLSKLSQATTAQHRGECEQGQSAVAISRLCCPWMVGDSLARAGAGFDLYVAAGWPCSQNPSALTPAPPRPPVALGKFLQSPVALQR